MKKVLLASLTSLFTLGLAACDTSDTTGPSDIEDPSTPSSSFEDPDDGEDFTPVTEDNDLSVEKESYTFSAAREGDQFPPDISIPVTFGWEGVTTINDDSDDLFTVEDETVIPREALSVDIAYRDQINYISGLTIKIDRDLVSVGTTAIKMYVQSARGYSPSAKKATLCFNVEIVEFGSIQVETYTVDLDVDTEGLTEKVSDLGIDFGRAFFFLVDSVGLEASYGYSADYQLQEEIEKGSLDEGILIEDFSVAVSHPYDFYIRVEDQESQFDFAMFHLKEKRGSGYSIASIEAGQSRIDISQDGLIEAEIDLVNIRTNGLD